MDRREKDRWLDALLVGGWVDRGKKWMVGWMDICIKDGWLDGWRKNMDSYMDRKHGWLDG